MSRKGKITDLYDVENIQKQQQSILDLIDKFVDQVTKANESKIGLKEATKPSEIKAGIEAVTAAQREQIAVTTQAAEATSKSVESVSRFSNTLKENIAEQVRYKARLSEIATELKALKKQQDLVAKTEGNDEVKKEIADRIQAVAEEQVSLKELNKDLDKRIKLQVQLSQGTSESIEAAQTEIALLKQRRDALDTTSQAKGIKEINDEIDRLNDLIAQNVSGLEQRKINIGNYQGSAKIIVEALKSVEVEITNLKLKQQGLVDFSKSNPIGFKLAGGEQELNNVNAQLGFTIKQAETLTQVTSNPKFLNIAAQVGDTNKELKFFTQRLNELEDAGLKNTDVYKQVEQRLAKLTDQLTDTRQEIKAMASDTRGFDLFAGSVSTLVSGFQAAAGAAALLGQNEEEVQKSIQKLIAIQNIASGVREVATQLTKKGTAANKAYNFVVEQGTILFGKGSTAAQRFGAALKGILIVAVIGFLTQLISKLVSGKDSADAFQKSLDKLNDELERNKKILSDLAASGDFDFKSRIEAIKQEGVDRLKLAKDATESEAIQVDVRNKLFEEEVKTRKDQLEDLRTQRKNADASVAKEEKFQQDFKIELLNAGFKTLTKDEADFFRDRLKVLRTDAEERKKAVQDGQRSLIQLQREQGTKQRDEELNQIKTTAEERRKVTLAQAKLIADDAQKEASRVLSDEKSTHEQRLAAIKKNGAAQRQVIIAENRDTQAALNVSKNDKGIAARDAKDKVDKINEATRLEEQKEIIAFNRKILQYDHDLATQRLNLLVESDSDLINNERTTYEHRLNAAQKFYDDSLRLLNENRDFELKETDQLPEDERGRKRLEIQEKYNGLILKLEKDNGQQIFDLSAAHQASLSNQREQDFNNRVADIQNNGDIELVALDKRFNEARKKHKGNQIQLSKDQKEYDSERLRIQYEQQAKILKADIEFAEKELEVRRLVLQNEPESDKRDEELKAIEEQVRKITALKIQLDRLTTDYHKDSNAEQDKSDEDLLNKRIARLQKLAAYTKQVLDIVDSFIAASVTKQLNGIQDEIDLLDKKKAKDIEVANQTIANAQDSAAAITVIEARAQAQEDLLNIKKRQAQERQARFEKAANIATLIQETAIAVVRALGDKSLPGPLRIAEAVVIGGLGLARIAAAVATPIPRYREGTKDHPGGLAEVGHGRAEAVVLPSGKVIKTPSTPTVMNLPRHTVVHPDYGKYDKMLAAATMTRIPQFKEQSVNDTAEKAMLKVGKDIVGAIKNKRETHLHMPGRYEMYMRDGSKFRAYLKDNL